jgi:hypothetical protein
MDETGDDSFTGTCIATDKHAGAGIGGLTDAIEDHPHGRVFAEEARAAGSFAESAARSLLQHAPKDRHSQVMMEGPRQKLAGACAKGFHHFSDRAPAGQGHHRNPRLTGLRGAQHLRSTVGEVHVHDTKIEKLCAQTGLRRLRGGSHNVLALQRRGDVLEGCLSDRIGVNEKEPVCHALLQLSAEETRG